jgi:hypothetical protein
MFFQDIISEHCCETILYSFIAKLNGNEISLAFLQQQSDTVVRYVREAQQLRRTCGHYCLPTSHPLITVCGQQ